MTQIKSELEQRKVVSKDEWVAARKAYLLREKEFTRLRDQLSADRRQLPWVKVDKEYVFEGPNGKKTLSDLFEGRSQLFVYHFMWLWDLGEGCPSCSFVVDSMSGDIIHLENHDVKFAAVSRAPWPQLEGFKKRMGWKFDMLSSFESDFNFDFNVSFTDEEMAAGEVYYNYGMQRFPSNEAPGLSVFYKDEAGDVFHTYSSYTRGLDILLGAYNMLDMTPKGRNEVEIMEWVRHHDKYENAEAGSCCH
jgi:predicted dithiol-disulfide oxidoreductase (DUF899 family)